MFSDLNRLKNLKRGRLLMLGAASFAAVGFALFTQFYWDMQPCPWCILQRMVFLIIGCIAIFGAFFSLSAQKLAAISAALFGLGGAGLALYQLLVASKQQSCSFSQAEKFVIWTRLDQLIPSVFQVTASCADAALAKLMGIPYELASGVLFAGITVWALQIFKAK
jgi:protein dithiol:quinone oxidoreductase